MTPSKIAFAVNDHLALDGRLYDRQVACVIHDPEAEGKANGTWWPR